jgi:hypothetical protein
MIEFPAAKPVIVATSFVFVMDVIVGDPLVKGVMVAAVIDPVNEIELPTQTALSPVRVGRELIVINFETVHPFAFL